MWKYWRKTEPSDAKECCLLSISWAVYQPRHPWESCPEKTCRSLLESQQCGHPTDSRKSLTRRPSIGLSITWTPSHYFQTRCSGFDSSSSIVITKPIPRHLLSLSFRSHLRQVTSHKIGRLLELSFGLGAFLLRLCTFEVKKYGFVARRCHLKVSREELTCRSLSEATMVVVNVSWAQLPKPWF